jgi:hypothetical protein
MAPGSGAKGMQLPWERRPRALATQPTGWRKWLNYWRPTARSYLGRVTKARILDAVREGVPREADGCASISEAHLKADGAGMPSGLCGMMRTGSSFMEFVRGFVRDFSSASVPDWPH